MREWSMMLKSKKWGGNKDVEFPLGRGSKTDLACMRSSIFFLKARYMNHVKTHAAWQNNANSIPAPSVCLDSLSCYLRQCHFKSNISLISSPQKRARHREANQMLNGQHCLKAIILENQMTPTITTYINIYIITV